MIRRFLRAAAALFAAVALFSAAGCGMKHSQVTAPAAAVPSLSPSGEERTVASADPADALARSDARPSEENIHWINGRAVITEPGNYRLARDFTVSDGDGITIRSNDVQLWLGEHTLTGPGNKTGRAIVVDGARNVLVRGGHVRNFGFGVVLLGSQGCRVREVQIEGGDETADPANGNPPQVGIMLVNSAMNVVAGNRLRDVNLGLFIRGGESYRNLLVENRVVGGQHGLLGICYNPADGAGPAGPHEDRVRGNLLARFGTGISASADSEHNRFVLNTIRFFAAPYKDANGTNVFEGNRSSQIEP